MLSVLFAKSGKPFNPPLSLTGGPLFAQHLLLQRLTAPAPALATQLLHRASARGTRLPPRARAAQATRSPGFISLSPTSHHPSSPLLCSLSRAGRPTAEPLVLVPAAPARFDHPRPCHGVPSTTRSNPPSSIWRKHHRGAAHTGSSPVPAATAVSTAPSSPATPPPITSSVSTSSPPSTLSDLSLELSLTPGRCRRGPPCAAPGRRRQPTSVRLRLHRPHR